MMTRSGPAMISALVVLVLAGWGSAIASLQRTTLTGTIERIDTTSNEAVLAIEGDLLPNVADPVVFRGTLEGVGSIPVEGTWAVSAVEGTAVRVRPTSPAGETATLKRDYVAEIESASPRRKPVPGGGGGKGGGDDGPVLETTSEILGLDDRGESLRREAASYFRGDGVPRDYARARRLYGEAAEAGSSGAMVQIGYMYENGLGVVEDDARAVDWYRKAAEAGNPAGQRSLGFMYQNGYGTAQDHAEAARLYRLAAEQGYPAAFNDLGTLYEYGWGVSRDYAEAMRLYRRAAELDVSFGLFNMAELYEHGRGVPVDEQRAIELYREAARRGHEVSQERLRARGLGWQQEN